MHGLSTLNRFLGGKKNKEASRSTTNLSKSSNNLDTSSQHNKISPIVNNAPFEQTFRVTVYLPKNQLFVERIGAKTKLASLMETICENKLLAADKYEFRHPGDMTQTFDNDKTIGEVGLNELKLVLKTESRFNSDFHRFHADDMMKYKSSVPDSVSSSEISRNYNKTPMQKASPYSSTTSLNSLDSTGMNLTAKSSAVQPPVAPVRKKKRAAPRPPSQSSIPEQEIFGTTLNVFKEPHSILPRKNFHVSSPQLFNKNNQVDVTSDKNNNIENGNRLNAITRPTSLYVTSTTDITQNGLDGRQRSPSESSEVQNILHERRNSNSLEKKKKPAPVPPKRTHKPVPSPRTVQEETKPPTIAEIEEQETPARSDEKLADPSAGNVSKTMLNNAEDLPSVESSDGPISIQIVSSDNSIEHVKEEPASPKLPTVSKVHIKLEEERRSSSEDEMTVNIYNVTKSVVKLERQSESPPNAVEPVKVVTTQTKVCETPAKEVVQHVAQASVETEKTAHVTASTPSPMQAPARHVKASSPSPVVTSVTSTTVVTSIPAPVLAPPLQQVAASSPPPAPEKPSRVHAIPDEKPVVREAPVEIEQRAQSPLWTYTLPAPPVFADSGVVDKTSPTDRQKSGDKFFSDFASTCNETILSDSNTTVISAETHIQPIIVERIPREESFIMTTTEYTKQVLNDGSDKSTEIITSDLEDGYLGNGKTLTAESPTPAVEKNRMEKEIVIEDFKRSRLVITRSDSFHSIGQGRSFEGGYKRGPLSPQRSTSFLSLVQAQKAENLSNRSTLDAPYVRQKSTSELSISDVPSLQSLEVIKNILNSSRKNSLQDSLVKEEKVTVNQTVNNYQRQQQQPIEVVKKEEVVIKSERQVSEPVPEKKPEPQWRYSGPPKINLSTWNERPTSKVSIAADRDYKFGGVAATLPRDFRNQQEEPTKRQTIHIATERVVEKEAEKHLPKVLGVEYKKDVSPVTLRESSAEIVTKPTRTIINIKPRPMSMDMSSSYSTLVTSTTQSSSVSYNRLNSNAKKFTPVVRGFKLNDIKEKEQNEVASVTVYKEVERTEKKLVQPPTVPAKPTFLRSTSAGDINRKMKFTTIESKVGDDSTDSALADSGLRKTGMKEKLLLGDKETKSIFGKVVDTPPETVVRYDYKETHVEKTISRPLSQPAPPPPPAAPPKAFRKSAPVELDSRNQLMDAIKNFNIDALRRK